MDFEHIKAWWERPQIYLIFEVRIDVLVWPMFNIIDAEEFMKYTTTHEDDEDAFASTSSLFADNGKDARTNGQHNSEKY